LVGTSARFLSKQPEAARTIVAPGRASGAQLCDSALPRARTIVYLSRVTLGTILED